MVVSLPANASTKKKNSSSLAGRLNCSPSSPVITADASVLQMSSVGLRRLSAVSSIAYPKMVAYSSTSSCRLRCAPGALAFRMRSRPSKIRGRSDSGMPMMSPMTVIGSASATSAIQSPPPSASRSSIIRPARARMPSSSLAMARGLNAWEMSLRRLFSAGGSMLTIVGYDENKPTDWMSGPSTAVKDSVSRCSRTACRCLVATQNSR